LALPALVAGVVSPEVLGPVVVEEVVAGRG
jgi:hypothetical protein